MDIPVDEWRNLIFVLRRYVDEDCLPLIDVLIWNGRFNHEKLEQLQTVLTDRQQNDTLQIIQQVLKGKDEKMNYSLLAQANLMSNSSMTWHLLASNG